ncbi:MAG: OmpA family protein [Candidatus Cloacimonetes bacterium]|nr:OmpA family protein [Candidatus Cloacimonadota bacterium]MCF7815324.1 OmpA family protein [Candidatus Cloacimonadota bacterium]MCF7883311.1 OmpA family protein [Candidatus Cloacimonadota bacterium]
MRKSVVVFVIFLCTVNAVFGQIYTKQLYLRFGGYGTKRIGGDKDWSTVRGLTDISLGYYISPRLGMEINAGYGYNTIRDDSENDWIQKYVSQDDSVNFQTIFNPISANLRFNILQNHPVIPYLMGGLGYCWWEIEETELDSILTSERNFMSIIGAGLEFEISRSFALDLSIRYHNYFDQDKDMSGIINNPDVSDGNLSIGLGFSIRFGGYVDDDGDGIGNRKDKCPNLPEDFDGFEDEDGCPDYDNDGDGLDDVVETNTGTYVNRNNTGTNPNDSDTDNDTISDYDEVYTYGSNPLKQDSDNDGISDEEEVNNYGTNPASADTDKDGLNDYDELFVYYTDPLLPDTDGDGFVDGRDKCPLEPETYNGYKDDDGCPDEKPEMLFQKRTPVILDGVQFASGSAVLTNASKSKIQKVINTLRSYPEMHLEISGHTDNTGSRNANIKLSKARADAVKNYIISQGIPAYRLRSIGLGPDYPIASNKTREGRARNRRIEFYRTK